MDDDYGFDSYDDAMDGDDLQNWETEQAWRDGLSDGEDQAERLLEAGKDGDDDDAADFYGFCGTCDNELEANGSCRECDPLLNSEL
jgi:hypothetical protein